MLVTGETTNVSDADTTKRLKYPYRSYGAALASFEVGVGIIAHEVYMRDVSPRLR